MVQPLQKYAVVLALASSVAVVAACKKEDGQPVTTAQAVAAPSADSVLGAINDNLGRMNYGEAVRVAKEAQSLFPGDYRIHAAAARAQARLNDPIAAADAFERAVSTGMPEAAKVLAEPAFDTVRGHNAFASYRTRTAQHRPLPRDTTSYVRSGDVEIIESANGDVIRAGDLVLDTRH